MIAKVEAEAGARGLILAYHDRGDGGLWATVCEMAFAGHRGVTLDLSGIAGNVGGNENALRVAFLTTKRPRIVAVDEEDGEVQVLAH